MPLVLTHQKSAVPTAPNTTGRLTRRRPNRDAANPRRKARFPSIDTRQGRCVRDEKPDRTLGRFAAARAVRICDQPATGPQQQR